MKMTSNGKFLLALAAALATSSVFTARFGGTDDFLQMWMAVASFFTGIGSATALLFCTIDTLLENEE